MGLLSKKDDIELRDELMAMKHKVDDLEEQGKTDSQLYKNFISQIDKYEQEIYLRRPGNPVTQPGIHGQSNVKGGFKTFGEQMNAVMRAGLPSGQTDARLFNAATGLGSSVPSDGGFLIQTDFSTELLKSIYETGKLAKLANRVQISGNANSIKLPAPDETSRATGSRWGGIQGYWADEAAEKTASKPKFRQLELTLKKLIGLCYATDELMSDAGMLETVLRQGFADEFGFLLDDAIINGSGAGMPLGLMNGSSLVTQTKEAGQAAATIVYENVLSMWARMLPGSQERCVWLVNNDCLPQLYQMSLAVGTGGAPVYLPASGASESPYASLFGRPVIPIEQCQTVGTTGDIVLADLTGGYLLAEKGGMKADMSIHVRFIFDESCFRFVLRIDGQPVLNSAITPFKGSATQSHFIALQTRS